MGKLYPEQVSFEQVGKREGVNEEGGRGARDEVQTGAK
jgi:hypothetical protein